MNTRRVHRLDGLEPDNLLAFLALLGLMRAIEESRPNWIPRVCWDVNRSPIRPVLSVSESVDTEMIATVIAKGLNSLARYHDFNGLRNLTLSPADATKKLHTAIENNPYTADLWASLINNAAADRKRKKVKPTPLCLLFGQGHQHFLSRLASVPKETEPPPRGIGRSKTKISEIQCLKEALFAPWKRPDNTNSFRWDPCEDVRYALRATDPTDLKTKETTQHGANRLAAIGLSALTVVPQIRTGEIQLGVLGGGRDRNGYFIFTWPIWCNLISLATIRSLLGHPSLNDLMTQKELGIFECRRTRRISAGKFMNFTRAESI